MFVQRGIHHSTVLQIGQPNPGEHLPQPDQPLTAVADLERNVGPLTVNHFGQLPAVTVSFNLAPGFSLGEAVNQINRISRTVLPATISGGSQGTAEVFQSSLQGLGILLVLAIFVSYMILGMLYESFAHRFFRPCHSRDSARWRHCCCSTSN